MSVCRAISRPLVVGHALAHRQLHAVERRAEAFHRRGCRRIVHFHPHQLAAGAFDQGAYGEALVFFPIRLFSQRPGIKGSSSSRGRT